MDRVLRVFSLSMIILFPIAGCTYDIVLSDCDRRVIENADMCPYRGQKMEGCISYIHKFKWHEEYYFDFDNTCVDKLPNPVDCHGIPLVDLFADSTTLSTFLLEAERLGIIGIEK